MAKRGTRSRGGASPPRYDRRVAARLREVASGLSFGQIERMTGFNHETVRRYMQLGNPSAAFLRAFCVTFGVSADQMLLIRPMRGRPRGRGAEARDRIRQARRALRLGDQALRAAEKSCR